MGEVREGWVDVGAAERGEGRRLPLAGRAPTGEHQRADSWQLPAGDNRLSAHARYAAPRCRHPPRCQRRRPSPAPAHLKPRSLFRPCRTLSPSSRAVKWPLSCSMCSRVQATVDLPLPLRPVNHSTHPRCSSGREAGGEGLVRRQGGVLNVC